MRHNEDSVNRELARQCRWAVQGEWDSPHVKCNLLLQCLLSRAELPVSDYYTDTRSVLDQVMRVLQAMVDVCCEQGWLQTVTRCCLLMQMIVQGRWMDDSTLSNVPHCDDRLIARLWDDGVECLPQLLLMQPERRQQLCRRAGLTERQLEEMSAYLQRLPSVEMRAQLQVTPSSSAKKVKRPKRIAMITEALSESGTVPPAAEDEDEDDDEQETRSSASSSPSAGVFRVLVQLRRTNADRSTRIMSPTFTKPKEEGWWLLLTGPATDSLLVCKRISAFSGSTTASLTAPLPPRGLHRLRLLLVSDSYLGLDQEAELELQSEEDEVIELPVPDWRTAYSSGKQEAADDQQQSSSRDGSRAKPTGSSAWTAAAARSARGVEFDDDDDGI